MAKFTKGRWAVFDDCRIYALPYNEADDATFVALVINPETHDKNTNEIRLRTAERNANAILIAHAPEMYELLKAIRKNMPNLAGSSELDGLFEAVFNAGRLLSRIDIESNAETEDAEP